MALIAADLSSPTLSRIWEQMRAGGGFPAVLGALTGAFGTSLTAIPPFAVVLLEGGSARIAVRGDLVVEVRTGSGSELVTGSGVTTWLERVIAAPDAMTLRGRVAVPTDLPVRDGVVLAAAVTVTVSANGTEAATGEVAPVASAVAAAAPGPAMAPVPAPASSPAPDARATPDVLATLVPTSSTVSIPRDPAGPAEAEQGDPIISAVPRAPSAPDPAPGSGQEGSSAYDHLWGETVIRSIEEAAVREHDEDAADDGSATDAPASGGPTGGDHDGRTISVAQARALRRLPEESPVEESVPPLASPRDPAPGRIRLPTGEVVLLDRTVVVGRRPRSTRVVGTDLPHLVVVESPRQDISRSHVELRVEGDSILATDLHTTNGTTLIREGADPMRLHPGEPTVVVPGDVVDLGDGQTLAVEGL